MNVVQLTNGWKSAHIDDGTLGGKTAFWKSYGNVIQLHVGKIAPRDVYR